MITLEHVTKSFKNGKESLKALDDVSLVLPDKGMVFLLGKSGSGKSTLLNLVGGLDSYEGTIDYGSLGKVNHHNLDAFRRANIGYVFQDFYLDEESTVFENIRQGLSICGIDDKEEVRKRADSALKAVSLSLYKRRKAGQLSLGQKQRVAIARAIASKPKILLADEPTGNLDSKNGENVMRILKGLSADILVLVVSHNENLAHAFADVLYRICDGKIQEEQVPGKEKNVLSLPKDVPLAKTEGTIGSIDVTLYQDRKETTKDRITILQKDGKTYIHLPEGFEVVKEEIRPVENTKEQQEMSPSINFDTIGFDDSTRKDRLFHKALFKNMMSRKGNRILVIISLLLAIIIPLCLGMRFQMYESRMGSILYDFSKTRQVGLLSDNNQATEIDGYLELMEDPDSGILSPSVVSAVIQPTDFEVLEPPFGLSSPQDMSYDSGFLSLECVSQSEVSLLPSSLSFSSLGYGDILIDKSFAKNLLASFKAEDYDKVIGTKWHFYGIDGKKKDYTIKGIIEGDTSIGKIYFAGLDSKDVFFLSALSRSMDPEASFALSDLSIRILSSSDPGGEEETAFGSDIFRKEMPLYSGFINPINIPLNFKSSLADTLYPEDKGKKVLYVPQKLATNLVESFFSGLLQGGNAIPVLGKGSYPDLTYVDTLSTSLEEDQIGVYLSKDLYGSFKADSEKFPVLDSSSYSREILVQGYFTGEGDLPSLLTDDFVLPLLIGFSDGYGFSWSQLYGSSGLYFRFCCQDAEKTIAYLKENYPRIQTIRAQEYFDKAVDTRDIDLFYVAILVVMAFLLTLYAIFFRTRLSQDENVIAIYRALGLERRAILVHYLLDVLGRVTLFFVLPYVFFSVLLFLLWNLSTPLYVHVLAILATYLLVTLFVLLPLALTLLKTPHQLLLKKDV